MSTASEGFARIDVEAKAFADPGTVLGDVRDAVDGIENFPPVSAEPPRVELKELRLEVLTLSVSASTLSENGLRLVAENIRDDLLALPSVSQIRLRGARDREIAIEMTEEELRRYDLSISQVASRIRPGVAQPYVRRVAHRRRRGNALRGRGSARTARNSKTLRSSPGPTELP